MLLVSLARFRNGPHAPSGRHKISYGGAVEEKPVLSVRQAAAACDVTQPVVRRWLPSACYPSHPGHSSSSTKFAISPIRRATVAALERPTAQWLAGTLDVAALIADGCKATQPENADEPSRRVAYPLRCESSSWLPSALAGHSGRYCVIWV